MASSLLRGIENSIALNLDCIAVFYYNNDNWQSITYAELNKCLHVLEEVFRDNSSVKCGTIILYLQISWTYPVLTLGILKAKHGFISIEEGDKDLLNDFLTNVNADYIFSSTDLRKESYFVARKFKLCKKINILCEDIFVWSIENDSKHIECEEYLYSIKTSGTTGLSKVIKVPHNSIFPNVRDLSDILQISKDDKILFMTPVTFDPSVIELFLAQYNGCSLCILDKQTKLDPQKMLDVLFPAFGGFISILQTTPSILKRWNIANLREKIFHRNSPLRTVILGGEEFPSLQEISSWEVSEHISLYNIYGITEISCWASINRVLPSSTPSNHIGEPLSETILKFKNINEENEGELLIGSNTRKCLVGNENFKNIFMEGKVLFRETGDIFKSINGKLIYIGRKDDVIKRWGSRFSLSEIERTAQQHENVAHCCCVCVQYGSHNKIGLFIVENIPSDDQKTLKVIKNYMRNRLPQSSWPDLIYKLSSLPLTKHGKVCKRTLKNICLDVNTKDKKQVFDEIWEMYTEDSSEEINFISAGGNSFTALQFFNELKMRFNDTPETFLGLLMQSKSKKELRAMLFESNNTDEEIISIKHKSNDPILKYSEGQNEKNLDTYVWKTYLKGRVSLIKRDNTNNLSSCDFNAFKMEEAWKYNLGKCVDASPLGLKLTNNSILVIIGSHSGQIAVLNIVNKQVLSKCTLPNRIESSACVIDQGDVYYVGCYDCHLYCIGTYSGRIIWKFQTDDVVKSSAVLHKTNIIFGSYDSHMYCLNYDGSLLWKTKLKSPVLAEPIADGNRLYCATLGSIATMSVETGQLLREISSLPIFSTPVINNGILIVANVKGKVMWINMDIGTEENSFSSADMIFSSLVKINLKENQEIILFGCQDSCIYCIKNRQLFWKTSLDSKIVSTPFVEIINYSESKGFVICFSSSGKAYLLDFSSGEKLCEYSLPGEVFSSPIIIDHQVIVGCRDDNVYILEIKQN